MGEAESSNGITAADRYAPPHKAGQKENNRREPFIYAVIMLFGGRVRRCSSWKKKDK